MVCGAPGTKSFTDFTAGLPPRRRKLPVSIPSHGVSVAPTVEPDSAFLRTDGIRRCRRLFWRPALHLSLSVQNQKIGFWNRTSGSGIAGADSAGSQHELQQDLSV